MKSTPQFSLQSFSFIPTNRMINTILHNSKPFFPALTSLKEEKTALFIARLAKRGACLTERETEADRDSSQP